MLCFTAASLLRKTGKAYIFSHFPNRSKQNLCLKVTISDGLLYTHILNTIIMLTLDVFWFPFSYAHEKASVRVLNHSILLFHQTCLLWIIAGGEECDSGVKVGSSYTAEVKGMGGMVSQKRCDTDGSVMPPGNIGQGALSVLKVRDASLPFWFQAVFMRGP